MKNKFKFLNKIDDKVIADFLVIELNQTLAVILLHLEPNKVQNILSFLPQEIQEALSNEMKVIGRVHSPSIDVIAKFLKKKLSKINKNYVVCRRIE